MSRSIWLSFSCAPGSSRGISRCPSGTRRCAQLKMRGAGMACSKSDQHSARGSNLTLAPALRPGHLISLPMCGSGGSRAAAAASAANSGGSDCNGSSHVGSSAGAGAKDSFSAAAAAASAIDRVAAGLCFGVGWRLTLSSNRVVCMHHGPGTVATPKAAAQPRTEEALFALPRQRQRTPTSSSNTHGARSTGPSAVSDG
eukprot:TRINITY_DN12353_c0_g1_i3.p1 TRINITY_DN12353_c0_g1~~TRINITY_DN12353_c0_g1_i3.p1  ORF type:complete len:199 (+),score=27.13 TRINITY_DN12353_c0_g1_i3:676-1272(+)